MLRKVWIRLLVSPHHLHLGIEDLRVDIARDRATHERVETVVAPQRDLHVLLRHRPRSISRLTGSAAFGQSTTSDSYFDTRRPRGLCPCCYRPKGATACPRGAATHALGL